jgi:hypothetical protein
MGSIVSLSAFKKKVAKQKIVTEGDEYQRLLNTLIAEWHLADSKNNINGFIADRLFIEERDFINDLNFVAELELDAHISTCVLSPGFDGNDDWVASFVWDDQQYAGMELESEPRARLFCVLLFYVLMEAASNTAK